MEEDETEEQEGSAPDLGSIFAPGQYFPAKVSAVYPTASQSFISQYPLTETTRLAARVEMSLVPEKVNSEVNSKDVTKGFSLVGEVKSREDKGWRIGLGLSEESQAIEGWLSNEDAAKFAGCELVYRRASSL